MTELIKNAEVVVFPYVEASQSGLLPYCLSERKKVVVTPLSGLLEQTSSHENIFVTKDFKVQALAESLAIAVRAEKFSRKSKKFSMKNIEVCLLESGFFSKE
jgi:rRNA maturation endonuclease Nob1